MKISLDLHDLSRRYAGRLLLRSEINVDESTFQSLLNEHIFTPKLSIIKKNFHHQCQRCGNQRRSLFSNIPCSLCKKSHLYCRNCIHMGRVMQCQPLYSWTGIQPEWPTYSDPCSWEGHLTPHQQRAANQMIQAIRKAEKEYLVWAVTGAGKTEMIYPAITEALKQGKRICIATPRADVVRELYPRLQQAFQSLPVQALYGGSEIKEPSSPLIIATTHQLLRFEQAFDVLIIDEIDAFPFHTDPSLPFAANRAMKKQNTTIYLTATPRKEEEKRIQRKQLPHTFVPLRFHGHPLPVPRMKMCFSLKQHLAKGHAPKEFLQWLQIRKNSQRQLLIFVPTIKLATELEKSLSHVLIEQKVISNKNMITSVHSNDLEREQKVLQFREKQIHVIITTTILERGVTFPSVDVAILDAGHTVFDAAALVQISGRAGRSVHDPNGEVIFFHDGKTDAMEKAIFSIKQMNKRGGF